MFMSGRLLFQIFNPIFYFVVCVFGLLLLVLTWILVLQIFSLSFDI